MCALLASSGTTPPYCSCTDWEAMMFDKILPSRHTAAEVSSQDDSMARTVQWEGWLKDKGEILLQLKAKVGFPAFSKMQQPSVDVA
jgi:hypothetical protein